MRIVITGASRGIGKMLANELSGEHEIFSISRKTSFSKASPKAAGRAKKITEYAADVTDEGAVAKVFGEIEAFDCLINCAGVLGPVGSFEKNGLQQWQQAVAVNLFGTVICCKLAIPFLKKSRQARIINFAGGGAAFPRTYHSAYASSKAAVVRFTENIAKDFEKDGTAISVNVLAPGAYKTGMWEQETFDKEPVQWADPEMLYKLVKFLLSGESKAVSGKFIHVKDDYRNIAHNSNEDSFTLRRVDNRSFFAKNIGAQK